MTHVALIVGAAAGLGWLLDRRSPEADVFRAPSPRDQPQVQAAIRILPGTICGVAVRDDDGPADAPPVSSPDSGPGRYYGAQLYALCRERGAWFVPHGTRMHRYPQLSITCLREWAAVWCRAYIKWIDTEVAAEGMTTDDALARAISIEFGGGNEERAIERQATRDAARSLARTVGSLDGLVAIGSGGAVALGFVQPVTDAILRLAIELGNAGHLAPGAGGVYAYARGFGGFADAYGDNFNQYVTAPVTTIVGGVAGVAGAAAMGVAGRVLSSPIGAALILFVAWRVVR